MNPLVCPRIRVWELADRFVLEPLDGPVQASLIINRVDGSFSLTGDLSATAGKTPLLTACGFLGTIKLLAGTYVVLATQRTQIGSLRGAPVYRLKATRVLSCAPRLSHLTPGQRADEHRFVALVKKALRDHNLLFSYAVDLTHRTQDAVEGKVPKDAPLWKQANPNFLFNKYLFESSGAKEEIDQFALPLMQGSFGSVHVTVNNRKVDVVLIARRRTNRLGTRMWRRGASEDGSVANFVESEQLLALDDGSQASYVQVRGSIPIFWEQVVDLTYKPKMRPLARIETKTAFEQHVRDLSSTYGPVIALDLVNQKGGELPVGSAFAAAADELKQGELRYVPFDFHKICGHTHFERLSLLFNEIKEQFQNFGYHISGPDGRQIQQQKGVVRTNCIDCLDRTNVTQSMLGRQALEDQLRRLGVFGPEETVSTFPDFDRPYKILWADHGDNISMQYTGTGALKGDFVRYGKRTKAGLLQDGQNAMLRYYYNNFADGTRQDALDLIMGKYKPALAAPTPFERKGIELVAYPMLGFGLLALSAGMAVMSVTNVSKEKVYATYAVLWASLSAIVFGFMKSNGKIFCDRPRLSSK